MTDIITTDATVLVVQEAVTTVQVETTDLVINQAINQVSVVNDTPVVILASGPQGAAGAGASTVNNPLIVQVFN